MRSARAAWNDRGHFLAVASIAMRATLVGSVAARKRTRALADLYLEPPTSDWSLLQFDTLDEIAERGYASAIGPLAAWREAAALEL